MWAPGVNRTPGPNPSKEDACPPGLAIDPSGAAFVSSSVLPVLWRIDPQRFHVAASARGGKELTHREQAV